MPYDTVVQVLRSDYAWPLDCAPAPKATAKALESHEPGEVAAKLDSWCWTAASSYSWGGTVPGSTAAYVQCRHLYFTIGCKYWEHSTSIALGQQHEIPEDRTSPARTVTEWFQNLTVGRDYMGYRNHDPESDEGKMRRAKALNVPLEWAGPLALTYQAFVLSGYEPDLDNQRGLDCQQALENLWARQQGVPIPWLPISRAN